MKKSTICVDHFDGQVSNPGLNTPIYTSTTYNFLDTEERFYPRYFNVPNQKSVIKKVALLESGEDGLIFSSGMGAISSTLFSLLNSGDHIIFQHGLYGGTVKLVTDDLSRMGISYSFLPDNKAETFKEAIQKNTKVIYLETPSNPLLNITDLEMVAEICSKHSIISVIDNTFASPINQNPISLGIDIVLHSATKYLSGHSDITAGLLISSKKFVKQVMNTSRNIGASIDPLMCYLLERSIKTLSLRVNQQNKNAGALAESLGALPGIGKIYYPGLSSHPGHEIAKKQMSGYGAMLSFELKEVDPNDFLHNLKLIKPALSLGGVSSTICSPATTSHRNMSIEEKNKQGISDKLLRLSVGIEDIDDLITDIKGALTS